MDPNSEHHASMGDEKRSRNDVWTSSSFSKCPVNSSVASSLQSTNLTSTGVVKRQGQAMAAKSESEQEPRGTRMSSLSSSRQRSIPALTGPDGSRDREGEKSNGPANPNDAVGPSQRDFETDPAHKFWKWSVEVRNWYHKDESTGEVLWAPLQLD